MAFFEEVDQLRVVERNIQRLVAIEKSEANKMAKIFKESIDRLERSLILAEQGSFTQASVNLALEQAELILTGLESRVNGNIRESSELVTEQSMEDLGREINKFSKKTFMNFINNSSYITTIEVFTVLVKAMWRVCPAWITYSRVPRLCL